MEYFISCGTSNPRKRKYYNSIPIQVSRNLFVVCSLHYMNFFAVAKKGQLEYEHRICFNMYSEILLQKEIKNQLSFFVECLL